jgi:hypothetical protein
MSLRQSFEPIGRGYQHLRSGVVIVAATVRFPSPPVAHQRISP